MRRHYLLTAIFSLSIFAFVAAGIVRCGIPFRGSSRRAVPATHETRAAASAAEPVVSPASPEPGTVRTASPPLVTEWLPDSRRRAINSINIAYVDQDGGKGLLRELVDKPAIITFFYTRCQYANKCSRTVAHLASLQRDLARAGVGNEVRLIAITYEPQYDTPDRIKRYGAERGLTYTQSASAVQLDPSRHRQLVDELEVPVGYNAGYVTSHGIELYLIDAKGRLVRKYHTVLWNNGDVLRDIRQVLMEESAM